MSKKIAVVKDEGLRELLSRIADRMGWLIKENNENNGRTLSLSYTENYNGPSFLISKTDRVGTLENEVAELKKIIQQLQRNDKCDKCGQVIK